MTKYHPLPSQLYFYSDPEYPVNCLRFTVTVGDILFEDRFESQNSVPGG